MIREAMIIGMNVPIVKISVALIEFERGKPPLSLVKM